MRSLTLALIVVASLFTSASAQQSSGHFPTPFQCPTCFVASSIDSTVGAIQGWASQCYNGVMITNVTATALVNGTPTSVPMTFFVGGSRPDVDAHLQANGCASNPTAGFVAAPTYGWPNGTTAYTVMLWYGDTHAWHLF